MRLPVFFIVAFLVLALEKSLAEVPALHIFSTTIAPSFMVVLVVFVSLCAPRMTAMWACLLLGLLMDLTQPLARSSGLGIIYLIGPHALGYIAGCWMILQFRTIVFRRRVLTVAVITIPCMIIASTVMVGLYVIRSWYPEPPIEMTNLPAMSELWRRYAMAVYSGVLAIPLGWLLLQSLPFWAFPAFQRRY